MSKSFHWKLSFPTVSGIKSDVYNCGVGLSRSDDESVYMQMVHGVTPKAMCKYMGKLIDSHNLYSNTSQLDNYTVHTFDTDNGTTLVSYNKKTGTMRVIQDNVSSPASTFDYYLEDGVPSTLYQYGLYYAPKVQQTGKTVDSGMMYILTLCDSKLLIVDSGHSMQASDEAIEGLWQFLNKITNNNVSIACWLCTQGDVDHMGVMSKLLRLHHDDIRLERCMFNFPTYRPYNEQDVAVVDETIRRIREYYPTIEYVKPHTGQVFRLANVNIGILYTHEDCVDDITATPSNKGTFCDSSMVVRLNYDHTTFLILSDIWNTAKHYLCKNLSDDAYKCDILQVANHGYNDIREIYSRVSKGAVLMYSQVPSHIKLNPKDSAILENIKTSIEPQEIFYEGEATFGIRIDKGIIKKERYGLVGGEYDNSDI